MKTEKAHIYIYRCLLCLLLLFAPTLSAPTTIHAAPFSYQECVDAQGSDVGSNICKTAGNFTPANATILTQLIVGAKTTDGEVIEQGALPTTSKYIAAMLDHKPLGSGEYLADVIHNLRLPGIQTAYAQGVGFSALSPVLVLWKAFRNLSYFTYIIIFVIIGFMIMFRQKVGHDVVVTIQQSLPKLIITLILITFSYAIAGFVIDLIYLSIFVATGLFETFKVLESGGALTIRNIIFGESIIQIIFGRTLWGGQAAVDSASSMGQLIGDITNLSFVGALSSILIWLIIAVALLIQSFKTFFILVTSFVGIILSVIFAPITLLMNAFPGSDAFTKWLKGLFANAAVFPATAIMIIIGAALVGTKGNSDFGINPENTVYQAETGWVPPLISGQNLGALDSDNTNAVFNFQSIIGLGVLLLLPEVAKMVKEALQVKEADYAGGALKAFQGGWGIVQKPIKAGTGLAMKPLKWLGGITGSAITQAGGTIISHKLMNIGSMKKLSQQSLLSQAEHQAKITDAADRIAQQKNLRRPGYPQGTADTD